LKSNELIGLHLRIKDSLTDLVAEALSLNLATLQFFLVKQQSNHYITLPAKEKAAFLAARATHFKHTFIHSSYWINPASYKKDVFSISRTLLRKELKLAKALEIHNLVLHPGSAKGYPATPNDPQAKQAGIAKLAKMLNTVLKKEDEVKILLENSAHGKRSIGNDLEDFAYLKQLLDFPEKIGFCFDTAHAYSYGYDIHNIPAIIDLMDKTMGLENIKLIHFNDSENTQGSMLDRHAFPGQGTIGSYSLKEFLNHPKLAHLPKIIEGPVASKAITQRILADIQSW
jgi:deoxyribonuclease IV